MRKSLLLYFILLAGLISQAFAQDRNINGKVKDAKTGEGIPGVSVFVKGSTIGTVTDFDGKYQLNVPSNAILVFQSVGLKTQEITVGNQSSIEALMIEETTNLGEIVVTGYRGEQDATKFSGAVATVKSATIEQVPMSTFDQILQGQAPGLLVTAGSGQPGTAGNVRIRGTSTLINGGGDPLYIMDGVPISSAVFASLNPNDIENVSVLKDASSASIYGSRGGNGVILISTKKGKSGKVQLNYRFQQGVSTRTRETFGMMNTEQKLEYERILATQGLFRGEGGAIWQAFGEGDITAAERDARLNNLRSIETDWKKEFFRTGTHQSHEINASGGNEKYTFFASVAYFGQQGISLKSDLKRVTSRLNLQVNATDKFRFGINASVNQSKSNFIPATGTNTNNPFAAVYLQNPYERVRDPETGEFAIGQIGRNMIREIGLNENSRKEFKAIGNVYLEYDIPYLKGLSAKTTWGIDYTMRTDIFYADPRSVWGQDAGTSTGSQGRLDRDFTENPQINGTTMLRYQNTIAEKHQFDILVANEIFNSLTNTYGFSGYGLNPKLGNTPGNTTGGSAIFLPDIRGGRTENSLLSVFANINYTFANKYSLDLGARRDGSSRFGKNNQYANFWNIGGTWNAKNEDFLKNVEFISNLRIRLNYGTVGNQNDIPDFKALERWDSQITYNGRPGIRPTSIGDPNLTWEEVAVTNLGIDFGFFNRRINGAIELYNRLTTRLFVETQLSRTSGFTELERNSGKMRNRGIEFSLNTINIQKGDFTWRTNFNITYNQNRILDLANATQFIQGTSIIRKDLPYGTHYLFEWAGVNPANGKGLYVDKNGNLTEDPTEEDNKTFGTSEPPLFGGITNTLTYKGLELSIFGSFVAGNQIADNVKYLLTLPSLGQFNAFTSMLNIWTTPGQLTEIARVDDARPFASNMLNNGSFFRLRNITLAYNLPDKLLNKAKIRSLRIYGQAQNVLTFAKYPNFDPEENNNINAFDYPVPRIFSLGVDLGF
jgi:TonB-linked SusC/RagA family outer membrane protein